MSANEEKNRLIISGQYCYWRYSYYYPRAFSPQATDSGHRHYLFYYLLGFLWGKGFKDIKLQPIKTLEEKTLYEEIPEDFSAHAFMYWNLSLWMNIWQHVQEAEMPPEHLLCSAHVAQDTDTSRRGLEGLSGLAGIPCRENWVAGFSLFARVWVSLHQDRPFYRVLSGARRRMLLFWPQSGRSVRLSWVWGQLLSWQNDKERWFYDFVFAYLATELCSESHHVELHSGP